MKRRIFSLFFVLLLLAGTVPPATAEDSPLSPVRAYQEQFSDVGPDDWYYGNIKALYEFGLTNGQGSPDRFAPEDDVTLAEALTMCARLRSLYDHGDSEAGPAMYRSESEAWYAPYVAYLQALHVIDNEFDGMYPQAATRAQTAHILAKTLPSSLFADINGDAVAVGYASRSYIRDVTDYTPYRQDILTLYRWGILSGMDRTGSFHPSETIQRSQMAAMVTRLIDSELRITLTWDLALAYTKDGTRMEELVSSDGAFYPDTTPEDLEKIDANIRYMLSRGERQLTLSYPPNTLTKETVHNILNAYLDTVRHYVEQTYNELQCSYSASSGSLILTFASSLYEDRMIDSYRESTIQAAVEVHDGLWADGSISPAMTEYDKARVYFTWLCGHCQYDYSSTESSMSHSGYSAFYNGLAVCDGYTAAYNLLLKLEGISCSTVSTADHIWTVAELDGATYHIDPTWGDQTGTIAYRYFAMTESAALARFS